MFYNIGFNSNKFGYVSSIKIGNKWQPIRAYTIWTSMLKRCYFGEFRAYDGVVVNRSWHDYQDFAKWYDEQPNHRKGKGWQLDKDLMGGHSGEYSPENCRLVPIQINHLIKKLDDKGLPQGVNYHKRDKAYRAYVKDENGNRTEKNGFKSEQEAFLWYKIQKEMVIKKVAEKYKDQIDEDLYLFLISYEVEDKRYKYVN